MAPTFRDSLVASSGLLAMCAYAVHARAERCARCGCEAVNEVASSRAAVYITSAACVARGAEGCKKLWLVTCSGTDDSCALMLGFSLAI